MEFFPHYCWSRSLCSFHRIGFFYAPRKKIVIPKQFTTHNVNSNSSSCSDNSVYSVAAHEPRESEISKKTENQEWNAVSCGKNVRETKFKFLFVVWMVGSGRLVVVVIIRMHSWRCMHRWATMTAFCLIYASISLFCLWHFITRRLFCLLFSFLSSDVIFSKFVMQLLKRLTHIISFCLSASRHCISVGLFHLSLK